MMRPPLVSVLRAICLLLAAAVVAGCGAGGEPAYRAWRTPSPAAPTATRIASISELPAAEIVERAVRATQAAGSVRVVGQLAAGEDGFRLDMRYDATGGGGRIRTGDETVNVLRIQREVWFSGDAGFWRRVGGERAVTAYRTKYLKIPASDQRFAPLVDTTYVAKLMQTLMRSKNAYAKLGTVTLRGQQAVVVADRTKGYGGTLWIAAEGQPYLLRVQAAKESAVAGAVDFLEYNTKFPLPPPDPRLVIDAKDLAQDEDAGKPDGEGDEGDEGDGKNRPRDDGKSTPSGKPSPTE